RQWFAALAVTRTEPALVIAAPYAVGATGLRPRTIAGCSPALPALPDKAMALEDLAGRRDRGPLAQRLIALEPSDDLLGTPAGVGLFDRDDPLNQFCRRRPAMLERSPRQVHQTSPTQRIVATKPLVTGLARNAVPLAPLRNRPAVPQPIANRPLPPIPPPRPSP